MNGGAGRLAMGKAVEISRTTQAKEKSAPYRNPIRLRHLVVLAALLVFPWVATSFLTYQIGAQSLALGLIALSLTFLGGYGGMVSLAHMTVAGFAAYLVAIFGTSSNAGPCAGASGGARRRH